MGNAPLTLIATLFPLVCWLAYNYGVPLVERRHPSLSVIMSMQRRRWVRNAVRRESPMDAILSGNLMGSVSLLASTSVLLVLAIFAAFGQLPAAMDALRTVGMGGNYSTADLQLHLIVMLAIFALSFFSFTLSLRQFNHFCILLGAIDHTGKGVARGDRRHRAAQFACRQELQQRHPRLLLRRAYGRLVRRRLDGDRREPRDCRLHRPPRVLLVGAPHRRVGRGDRPAPR